MGKKNVVLWDGTVVAVDEDTAKRLAGAGTGRAEGVVEGGERQKQAYDEANTSAARAFGEGLADTLTFGGYGQIIGGTDSGHRMRVTAQQHGDARLLGELTGMLAPGGILGKTAKEASALTSVGLIDKAGKALGGLKGQALEGALLGVQGGIAHANVTGDPLTVESAILDAGVGAVANVGMGLIAKKFTSMASKSAEVVQAAKAAELDAAAVTKGKQLFEREYPLVDEFNAARKSSISEVTELNTQIQKEIDAYDDLIAGPDGKFKQIVKGTDKAINTYASRYRPAGTYGTMEEALAAAESRAGVKASELNVQPRPDGGVSQSVTETASGTTVGFNKTGYTPEGVPTRITDRIKLDSRPPMSPEIEANIKRWRNEISEIRQLFAGGRQVNGQKWGKLDPSIPRNPELAVARMHELKKEIWANAQDAAGHIPKIPIVRKVEDLLPTPPELPKVKTLEYLSRMDETSIAKMANSLSKGEADVVMRLAKELDVEVKGTPAQALVDIHAGLKNYRKIIDAAEVAEKEAKEAAGSGFGKLLHHSARLVGARAGNRVLGGAIVGGAIGWATGNFVGGIAGSLLTTALMNGKAGVRNRIAELFATYGTRAGKVVQRMGPVASSLAVRFRGGEDSGDLQELAKLRSLELTTMRGAANDISYTAFEPFLQAPHDLALKLHAKWTGIVNYLADSAPKDHGLAIKGFGSGWRPSPQESLEFAHRYEAAMDPWSAIQRAFQGQSHPAACESLWTCWPTMMSELADELALNSEVTEKMSHPQLSSLSRLFRVPLTGFDIPEIALAAQAMYLPGNPGNPYTNNPDAGFGNSPSANPPGRPPATGRTEVAGSSPSKLTQ